MGPAAGGGGQIEQRQVVADQFTQAAGLFEQGGELRFRRTLAGQAPDRRELGLGIELETVVHAAIEVDGQLRHAGQWRADQHRCAAPICGMDGSGEAEIAIQPRIQQGPAIDLDAQLQAVLAAEGRTRLEPQMRRIGVGADKLPGCWCGCSPQPEGDHCRALLDVPAAGPQLPAGCGQIEPGEAGGAQALDHRRRGMDRRRAGIDEGAEVGGHGGSIRPRDRSAMRAG